MKCWRWLARRKKSFTADAEIAKIRVELLLQSEPKFPNDGKGEKPKWKNVNQRRGCRQNVAKIRVAGLGNDPESTFRFLNLLDPNNR